MARLSCPPGLQAAALHNLGEALARTGELDEALWHLECSVALCRRLGPARAALGLVGTPTSTGRWGTRSRAAPPTPRRRSSPAGPATSRCSCRRCAVRPCWLRTNRPARPRRRRPRHCRLAPHDLLPIALTTTGRVAAARGDRAAAAEHARRAVAGARDVRAADLLADALELEASRRGRPGPCPRGADRGAVDLVRGRSRTGRRPRRGADRAAAGRRGHGSDLAHATPRGPSGGSGSASRRRGRRRSTPALSSPSAVLGPFAVTVGGAEVPLPAWRSKQARTLVKILAAYRGRVVTRARLCDLLWPDDDPATDRAPTLGPARHRARRARPGEGVAAGPLHHADQYGLRLDLGDRGTRRRNAAARRRPRVRAHRERRHRAGPRGAGPRGRALSRRGVRGRGRGVGRRPARGGPRGLGPVGAAPRDPCSPERAAATRPSASSRACSPSTRTTSRCTVAWSPAWCAPGRHGEARRAFDRWCQAMQEIDAPPPDPTSRRTRR